jgi:hypothetical protein
MKRRMIICCAMMLLSAAPAMAVTGSVLKQYADLGENGSNVVAKERLAGYVAAIVDNYEPLLCIPEGTTDEQVIEVVKKYLNEHPEQLHRNASIPVVKALGRAFPCK